MSEPTEKEKLLTRIDAAIERITSGLAAMRIPAETNDPDLVLADCKMFILGTPTVIEETEEKKALGIPDAPSDNVEHVRQKSVRYFLDTEFIEAGRHSAVKLISIGIVSEDGRAYYAESQEFDPKTVSDWLKDNVLPHLGPVADRKPVALISKEVREFIGDTKPEFWGYYADYDWVVFCQMFGSMCDLPKGWPMYCRDIKQLCDSLGNPKLPQNNGAEHNALSDAKWNELALRFLLSENSNAAGAPPVSKEVAAPPSSKSEEWTIRKVKRTYGFTGTQQTSSLTVTIPPHETWGYALFAGNRELYWDSEILSDTWLQSLADAHNTSLSSLRSRCERLEREVASFKEKEAK